MFSWRSTSSTIIFVFLFATMHAQTSSPPRFFPYDVKTKTLANGLNVVVIPTPEFRGMVTFSTVVFAGSRNETQAGKTGLAHLFEHIMFRHELGGEAGGYQNAMEKLGAFNNAWTDYDLTYYHPTTFTANLVGPVARPGGAVPGLVELEASRFKNLKLDRKIFQLEAGAVLGEYRRIFSDPGEKMIEELSPAAFPHHPYGHTVIGYEADVENMPTAWDAAWEFYGNYYKPNNVALVIVGDVDPAVMFRMAEVNYGDWKPSHPPQIPAEQPPAAPQNLHVSWQADVSPRLFVGYHTPAMQPGNKETAVSLLLPELLTSRSAPLYQKLRYQKQSVTDFNVQDGRELLQATDPHLLLLNCELGLERLRSQGPSYVADVQKDVLAGVDALKQFSRQPNSRRVLQVIQSKFRNDLLARFDSTPNIAEQFAWFYRFNRDPNVFDTLVASVNALKPGDIDAYAARYFIPSGRVITTLWRDSPQAAVGAKP